jgi:hypothetical protein
MGRYASLVGKRVEAHYRAGDIHLVAVGTLVANTQRSIFVQEQFSQGGRGKTMRVEIPLEYIIRVVEIPADPSDSHESHFVSSAKVFP